MLKRRNHATYGLTRLLPMLLSSQRSPDPLKREWIPSEGHTALTIHERRMVSPCAITRNTHIRTKNFAQRFFPVSLGRELFVFVLLPFAIQRAGECLRDFLFKKKGIRLQDYEFPKPHLPYYFILRQQRGCQDRGYEVPALSLRGEWH